MTGIPAVKNFHVIFLRAPLDLLARIDEFKHTMGFKTRTSAVFRLLHMGLALYDREGT